VCPKLNDASRDQQRACGNKTAAARIERDSNSNTGSPKFDFGVIRDERNPSFLEVNPDTGSDYVITAELFIRVQDEVVTVYSGYHKSDPLQGEVYATIPGGGAHFYPTPDTTGPAKLIAVNGTVLTIETIGGTYEQYEAGTGIKTGSVTAKGGSRYEFDLVARSFR
jgi:hypothetical protein